MNRVLARALLRMTRRGGLVWIAGFASLGAATVLGYRGAYPTEAARAQVAGQIGGNLGFQALYGRARNLADVGGFTAWRVGGLAGVLAAVWGSLLVTRLLRGDEEAGRVELLLAQPLTPRAWLVTVVAVGVAWQVASGAVLALTLMVCGLAPGGAALIGLCRTAGGGLGVVLGSLTSHLAAARSRAALMAGMAVGAAYLVRVLADGTASLGWLRWSSPFGWTEEVRPFAGSRVWPFGLFAAIAAAILFVADALLQRRDHFGALLADDAVGPPRSLRLRGSISLGVRLARRSVVGWCVGLGIFGAVIGLLANDVARFAAQSPGYADAVRRLGIRDPNGPASFVGLAFGFLAVAVALQAASQMIAVRGDEAEGRADLLLAPPLARSTWVLGRAAVTMAGSVVIAVVMALAAWAAVAVHGGGLSVADAVRGGLNLVPLAWMVVGVGVLASGFVPRWTAGVVVGVVTAGYVVELVGALLRAPAWVLDLSPFHHVPPVPAVGFRLAPMAVLVAVAVVSSMIGALAFGRRDVVTA